MTGVQTCALPILRHSHGQTIALELVRDGRTITVDAFIPEREEEEPDDDRGRKTRKLSGGTYRQIGRASCRERG